MLAQRVIFLIVVLKAATALNAASAQEEASKLIAADANSGGKTVPKGAKPMALRKGPERRSFDEGDPAILILPKVEVTAPKISAFEKRLVELEKEEAREDRSSSPTRLDSFLNSSKFSILGGSSANARAARARDRVDIMNWERILLVALVAAKTPEERSEILKEIKMMRGMRR